ncbi:MAG: hypothetical protein ACTIMA_14400 [Brachybacterium tyrofermentans]|uniref:Flp pilus-assembly TadG-like N-terminal domain-containing protein n=1 Tax=Brachybacterium tyrofermentans TaxID=47848 RepID=A0ABW0FLA5_9MICO|nr:hypothetical protein [Brachybacterium tyrofermentans]SLN01292.1 hypothetical protein FM103_09385 [Corynebacterium xerosis]
MIAGSSGVAVLVVIALVVVVAALVQRGGPTTTGTATAADAEARAIAARAQADAEAGYAEQAEPFEERAAERQAAIETVLGAPIDQTWYIECSGIPGAEGGPAEQLCSLTEVTTYAMEWSDPTAAVDEMVAALESADDSSWTPLSAPLGEAPHGMVAESDDGYASVREPGFAPEVGHTPVTGLFPDGVLAKHPVAAQEPPRGSGTAEVRVRTDISRSDIGCDPLEDGRCGSLLTAPAMPHVDGFS